MSKGWIEPTTKHPGARQVFDAVAAWVRAWGGCGLAMGNPAHGFWYRVFVLIEHGGGKPVTFAARGFGKHGLVNGDDFVCQWHAGVDIIDKLWGFAGSDT